MTLLKLVNLTFAFPGRLVFEGLDLSFQPGEVIALLGANGAGKTTLLRTIARQIQPSHGNVILESRDTKSFGRLEFSQKVSLMPQFEQRDLALRVEDVVRLGRVPHRGWLAPLTAMDEACVSEAMEITGVWDLRERPIAELSGGEWRRMVLARALAQNASVLLLDEPTAGLDLKYQLECLERVQQLAKQRNLLAIITLHDLNQASLFADRIVLLSEHHLFAVGTPREVLTPQSIQRTFGIEVSVIEHPASATPLIIPLRANEARL